MAYRGLLRPLNWLIRNGGRTGYTMGIVSGTPTKTTEQTSGTSGAPTYTQTALPEVTQPRTAPEKERPKRISRGLIYGGLVALGITLVTGGLVWYLLTRDAAGTPSYQVSQPPAVATAAPSVSNGASSEPAVVVQVTLETRLLNRLYEEVPEIKEFPDRVANAVVTQVKTDFYDKGLAQDEQKVWQYVAPTVRQGLSALSRRDYVRRDANGNVVAAIAYSSNGLPRVDYNRLSDGQIGHVLLNERLGEVNLLTGERSRFSLDTAVLNVTPINEEKFVGRVLVGIVDGNPRYQDVVVNLNGLSPVERITGLALQDYLNKNSDRYVRAIRIAKEHHQGFENLGVWQKSNAAYQREVEKMLKSGKDFSVFLYGYPHALNVTGVVPRHPTSGQVAPFYTVVIAGEFGIPAEVVRGIYPTSLTGEGVHDEPFVFAPDHPNDNPLFPQHFGFWDQLNPFQEDYENKPWNKPSAWVVGINDEKMKQLVP